MCFNAKYIDPKYVHSFAYPDNKLVQGRLLAVREKSLVNDFLHLCCYWPNRGTPNVMAIVREMKK